MRINNFQVSKYFWFNEIYATNHVDFLQDNFYECIEFLFNATLFAREVLDHVRDFFGPMYPSSWFRGPELNEEVRGSINSQHLRGTALDYSGEGWNWEITQIKGRQLYDFLKERKVNAKIIMETSSGRNWLHISRDGEPTLWQGVSGIYTRIK